MKMKKSIQKIVFIGSGNVATNLAYAMFRKGFTIVQIISKSLKNASLLASGVNAACSDNLSEININADLYIISVNDTALPEICKTLRLSGKLVVHTSGYVSMRVLENVTERCGVFYPLQSFVKQRLIDLTDIPVCLEASNEEDIVLLKQLAEKLELSVNFIDSPKRKQLHLAAVFACNFSNFMYGIAEEILTKHKIPFELLLPLVNETAGRLAEKSPWLLQTGPARRKDLNVMKEHLSLINNEDYKEIYELMSRLIVKKYYPDEKL